MIIIIVLIWIKPSGLYRHQRGLGFTPSRLQRRKSNIRIAKLVFHAKESPIRTRDGVSSLVSSCFNSPDDVYSPAVRIPPNPGLPQQPLNQASMMMSPARGLVFGIARRVPPSEYSKVIIKHVDRVRICKMIFTYHRRENDTSADNFLNNMTCPYGRVIIRTVFLQPATSRIARQFP